MAAPAIAAVRTIAAVAVVGSALVYTTTGIALNFMESSEADYDDYEWLYSVHATSQAVGLYSYFIFGLADDSYSYVRASGLLPPKLPPTTATSVEDKAYRYFLNPDHPEGGPKAKWFEKALGFNRSNQSKLTSQIVFNESHAKPTVMTTYGQKYEQIINIQGANGKTIGVPFIWLKYKDDGVVRLVTVPSIPSKGK